jgi:hypothetical protein
MRSSDPTSSANPGSEQGQAGPLGGEAIAVEAVERALQAAAALQGGVPSRSIPSMSPPRSVRVLSRHASLSSNSEHGVVHVTGNLAHPNVAMLSEISATVVSVEPRFRPCKRPQRSVIGTSVGRSDEF